MKTKLLFSLSFPVIAAAALAVCNWTTNFPESGGCTSEGCGVGCSPPKLGPVQKKCYTSMDDCCNCKWYNTTCDCIFGSGTGRVAIRSHLSMGICTNAGVCVAPADD